MIWDFRKHAENTALIWKDKNITYQELFDAGEEFAAALPGRCLLFILTENSPGAVVGYTSCVNHGIVPLLLDIKINRDLLQNLMEVYRPQYLWVPEKEASSFSEYEAVFTSYGFTLLDTHEAEPWPLHPDLTLLISTSGSTGSPKLVRQTARNLRTSIGQIVEFLKLDENERPITSLPMNYVYGLSVINSHLEAGASIVMTNVSCYVKAFWQLVKEKEVTSFAGVPFTYELLKKLNVFRTDYPSLRTFTESGGKMSEELQAAYFSFCAETGRQFILMYGASEATSRMSYLPFAYPDYKKVCIGMPVPRGRFELVDVNGGLISEPGVQGELVYYGDNVSMGYAVEGADLAKGDENRGRLLTGDIACRDEDNCYYICGRKKRFIKIGGRRMGLDEIEFIIKNNFDVLDVACAGVDEELMIFLTDDTWRDQILARVHEMTGINVRQMRVCMVEEIPKSSAGKTLYGELMASAGV